MTMNVNVSGVWKNIAEAAVNVSGVWKDITNGYVNVSGVWKEFFTSDSIYIPLFAEYTLAVGADAVMTVTFNTNGSMTSNASISTLDPLSWWTGNPEAGAGTPYELRVTVTAGTMTTGSTGTWLALTAPRSFGKTQVQNGDSTVTFTVEFRRTSDSVVVFTKTGCTMQCVSEAA